MLIGDVTLTVRRRQSGWMFRKVRFVGDRSTFPLTRQSSILRLSELLAAAKPPSCDFCFRT